jgi:hypothetical protein
MERQYVLGFGPKHWEYICPRCYGILVEGVCQANCGQPTVTSKQQWREVYDANEKFSGEDDTEFPEQLKATEGAE